MKVVIGLGNPGKQYAETRHNIGFSVVEALAQQYNITFKEKKRYTALVGETRILGDIVWLVKPLTYMNLSGKTAGAIVKYKAVRLEDILVVVDDIDLKFGTIRIRRQGGSGGHNGLKSIIEVLGNQKDFPRLRIGIGRDDSIATEQYVLGTYRREEKKALKGIIEKAVGSIELFLQSGVEVAMNQYNLR